MDGYIEREAMLSAAKKLDSNTGVAELYIGDVLDFIQDFPAADVRPVVHGKWIFKSRWHDSIDENLCSECGQLLTTAAEKQMNFCPNCGARLDGGTE